MGKSFGARKRDTGEAINDAYPLNRLVDLLCFEDLEEARVACHHYNITVKQVQVPTASRDDVAEIIFWRASEFKEPTHPEKGFVIPLPPRKMTRTIERKLDGATRLAVCRGEVSGEGATLHSISTSKQSHSMPSSAFTRRTAGGSKTAEEERARASSLLKKQQLEAAKLEREALLRKEEEGRIQIEKKKQEEERLNREAQEKEAKEFEKQRILKILESKEREAEALKAIQLKDEAEKKAAKERLREDTIRRELEAEAKRKRHEAEEERRMAENAWRLQEEARVKREQEQSILEEKRRLEEAKRQETLQRELKAKCKREAEERRKAREWDDKVNTARKIVVWRRWQNRIFRAIETTHGSAARLRKVDPTFLSHTLKLRDWLQSVRVECSDTNDDVLLPYTPMDTRRAIEASIQDKAPRISLSEFAVHEMTSSQKVDTSTVSSDESDVESKVTLLLKVALLIPASDRNDAQSMEELLKSWIHSRVGLETVFTAQSWNNGTLQTFEARSTVHFCRSAADTHDCDVALVVVPPPWSTGDERRRALRSISSLIDDSMPRVVLALGDFDYEGHEYMKSVLAEEVGPARGALSIICNRSATPLALEKGLESSCKKIASIFVNETCVKIDRMPIPSLAKSVISIYLWSYISPNSIADGNLVLETARCAISALIKEASIHLHDNKGVWSSWPPREFVSNEEVKCYFSNGAHLPLDWKSTLCRENLVKELTSISHRLTGSFRDVVESFLFEAPKVIREECGLMVTKGYYRRCLQAALDWFADHPGESKQAYIYFPRGLLEVILDQLASQRDKHVEDPVPALLIPQDTALLDTIEEIDQSIIEGTDLRTLSELDECSLLTANNNNNKRRRQDVSRTEESSHSSGVPSSKGSGKAGSKKLRSSTAATLNTNTYMDESAAFTKRLEALMNGATVDLEVGDCYLSKILRGVPNSATNSRIQ